MDQIYIEPLFFLLLKNKEIARNIPLESVKFLCHFLYRNIEKMMEFLYNYKIELFCFFFFFNSKYLILQKW
jgi:hypothetical protein